MTRINTNVSSLIAQHNLDKANGNLSVRLQRLSTGLRINRGADDPAGLIVSERLRSEIAGVDQAIENAERATNVIATAEAALQEISTLLTSIKGLTVEAANTGAFSEDEIEANQLQIDDAIASITRISNTTSFAGLKLIDGSLDYVLSGVDSTNVRNVRVFSANFGTNQSMPVDVEVLNSAENGQLFLSAPSGTLLSSVSFEVQGNTGVEALTFVSGTALSAVAAAINAVTDATGASASLVNGADQTSGLVINSTTFGTDAFVSVRKLEDGDFFQTLDSLQAQGGPANVIGRDAGEDVLALVNGNLALGDGREVSIRSTTLTMELSLTEAAATTLGTHSFTVTGGGALFQVGPSVNSSQQVGFGVQSVSATHLGDQDLGFLNSVVSGGDNSLVNGAARDASQIIDKAIDQISLLRGRLGAFERNTLQTSVRSQQIALENLTASESEIRDADFAAETAELTRAQVLTNAGTSVLALANSSAQNVLSLLQ